MKLSAVLLLGIVLIFSDTAKASNCTAEVDAAQGCVKQCGSAITPDQTNNLLNYCVGNPDEGNLTTCCQMEEPCVTTMSNANNCLDNEFARVGAAAEAYFDCLLTPSNCFFGAFCVNIFAGGYNTNASTNFAVATRQADSCEDPMLNSLGYDACDALGTCCDACDTEIADLVNAVLDDILLTTYGQPGVEACSVHPETGLNKTCAYYLGEEDRRLETNLVGPAGVIGEYDGVAKELALECNTALADDVILYNESYAVGNYFDCLYKKTGKAAAVLDDAEQASSGISLLFGPAAALSTMASVVYSAILS